MSRDDFVSKAMKRADPVPPGDLGSESGRSPDEMLAHVKAPAKRESYVGSAGVIPRWHHRGPAVFVGTFVLVVVLGVGSALFFRSDPGAPTSLTEEAPGLITPIETVQSLFDAWNRGDVEAYLAVQDGAFVDSIARIILEGGDENQQPNSEEAEALIRDDFTYWFLIGTEWKLTECSTELAPSGSGDHVNCQLTADSAFARAYGEPNDPRPVRYTVAQGLITAGSADRPGRGVYTFAAAAFFSWVQESIDAGSLETSTVPCPTTAVYRARQGRVPSGECSQWIADHLPQWIATLDAAG
jgi:hypothetical protein